MNHPKYDPVAILDRAADAMEQGWCQQAEARTVGGSPCVGVDEAACCWCADGAIREALFFLYDEELPPTHHELRSPLNHAYFRVRLAALDAIPALEGAQALNPATEWVWDDDLEAFNDHRLQTQERMVALFRLAAQRMRTPHGG